MNRTLLKPEIQQFIKDHENHDPFHLSLEAKKYGQIPVKDIAGQIQARQKARHKIPEWLQKEGLYFPPPLSIEQSSSETTARYKAGLIPALAIIDLTGGAGVDAYYFSQYAARVVYVEKDEELAKIARHNFDVLKADNIEVKATSASRYLREAGPADLIYIDPSRRAGKKVFTLEESEPDVTALIGEALEKAPVMLIKTSPLLDINRACAQLPGVSRVDVVSVNNECKEVLYQIRRKPTPVEITAVNILQSGAAVFIFTPEEEKATEPVYGMPEEYLYEPNVSILKAGAFKCAGMRFGLKKLHKNTHLYTADGIHTGFPGKIFRVEALFTYNKKTLKNLRGLTINVISRNFPLTSNQLKKMHGLRDGGDAFLIFTTNLANEKIVIQARKL